MAQESKPSHAYSAGWGSAAKQLDFATPPFRSHTISCLLNPFHTRLGQGVLNAITIYALVYQFS
jgi:hypothetical protein